MARIPRIEGDGCTGTAINCGSISANPRLGFGVFVRGVPGRSLQAGTPELAYATYVRSCGIEKPTGSSGTDTFQDPRFIGPYEILERVGPVPYRLALPPNLSGVHNVFHVSVLRKYIFDPTHVLDATPLELQEDLSFEEQPLRILAREVKRLRNREIPYVKVLWSNHDEREATWELESALRERYPHLFQMEA
uniref:Tf2-1-like SH3-like domain-containing protein n=1 Tax=Ananas comosus var. bracteatus TaxID=296719 RepID=A0A6V7Q9V6_ANACO|nr:unnamed protein product [Ananas comosus var. bracteatus]